MIDLNKKYLKVTFSKSRVYKFSLCKGLDSIPFAFKTCEINEAKAIAKKFVNIISNDASYGSGAIPVLFCGTELT